MKRIIITYPHLEHKTFEQYIKITVKDHPDDPTFRRIDITQEALDDMLDVLKARGIKVVWEDR